MHCWLLDAKKFRLVKIIKYNLNTSGQITGLTVLSLWALGMDSVRLLVCSPISLLFFCSKVDVLTALDFFCFAPEMLNEHVENSNPRILPVHCCEQAESWS